MFVWKHRAKTTNASWNASRRGGSTEIASEALRPPRGNDPPPEHVAAARAAAARYADRVPR